MRPTMPRRKREISLSVLTAVAMVGVWVANVARADNTELYDVAILNGRVMDPESGLDAKNNVGIRAGRS